MSSSFPVPARFIPTPVGNTVFTAFSLFFDTVHPHARGEHALMHVKACLAVGSSPRPWGTHARLAIDKAGHRFIPTPVGNTSCARPESCSTTVHPHARGEHIQSGNVASMGAGSSPRPWGTLQGHRPHACKVRFIPTPVGNTSAVGINAYGPAVHPHARGEHTRDAANRAMPCGSSPRPWGTREPGANVVPSARFIPTPVGNTFGGTEDQDKFSVHPHARGEHLVKRWAHWRANGSSPRPWGTLATASRGA